MPTTWVALAIGIALVPGWAFLQWTRETRRPGTKSALAELLEIVAVGTATTGTSCLLIGLVFPNWVLGALSTLSLAPAAATGEDVRAVLWLVLLVIVISVVLAYGSSRVARHVAREHYSPSTMQGTLGRERPGYGRAVGIQLKDGTTIDGLLHAYAMTDDDASRVIALRRPLRMLPPNSSSPRDLPFDHYIALGSEIRSIVLTHQRDPGAVVASDPKWWRLRLLRLRVQVGVAPKVQ
jgi:Family of unknown function (DUF6338)